MDVPTIGVLQDLVRKEGRSLLQYVSESFPWTTPANQSALPVLFDMAREEREGTAALVKLLLKNRARPPYLGAYPMSFTNINYMSLDFLVPCLIEFEKRRRDELTRDLSIIVDDDAKLLVRLLLQMKELHLATLHQLSEPAKPAA